MVQEIWACVEKPQVVPSRVFVCVSLPRCFPSGQLRVVVAACVLNGSAVFVSASLARCFPGAPCVRDCVVSAVLSARL